MRPLDTHGGVPFHEEGAALSLRNIRIEGVGQLTSEESECGAPYPFLKESIFGTDVAKVKEAVWHILREGR